LFFNTLLMGIWLLVAILKQGKLLAGLVLTGITPPIFAGRICVLSLSA